MFSGCVKRQINIKFMRILPSLASSGTRMRCQGRAGGKKCMTVGEIKSAGLEISTAIVSCSGPNR